MKTWQKILIFSLILVLVSLLGLSVYGYKTITKIRTQNTSLQSELSTLKETLAQKEANIAQYGTNLEELKKAYALSEENGSELLTMLTNEREKNSEFEDQIDRLTGTVGKLNKLSKIDPELLIKYSRVYFLSENYKPEKTTEIDSQFLTRKEKPEYIHSKVAGHLNDLLQDAKDDGIDLLILSGYRSFDDQMKLKSGYSATYGYGANAFSADQGYSEHQLGTTVDFTTSTAGMALTGFETTDAYAWLQKNAYRYGFILSYPKENIYYIFEPWHWRFVGEKLAGDLHDDDKFFYNLDQREIDKYLISIFD